MDNDLYIRVHEVHPTESAALQAARELVGKSDFPKLCETLAAAANTLGRGDEQMQRLFFQRTLLFFADTGRGVDKSIRILSDIIAGSALQADSETRRIRLTSVEDAKAYQSVFSAINNNIEVIMIDLTAIAGQTEDPGFRAFLDNLSHCIAYGKSLLVFRFPYLPRDRVEQIHRYFEYYFSATPVIFEPFTDKDVLMLAVGFLRQYGAHFSKGAARPFLERVAESRNAGCFFGARTVEHMVDEIMLHMVDSGRQFGGENKPVAIRSEDVEASLPSRELIADNRRAAQERDYEDALEELHNMVGMEQVEEQVRSIIRSILYTRKIGLASPSFHMCFTGNPGTGKTTVARIIAKTLKDCGVLRVGNCIECNTTDLIAGYVGQTAKKTRDVCASAYGSVLFIDEAYMLASDNGSFAGEALAELLTQIENHRDDLLVILSGYAVEMEKMLSSNAGMKRRFPFRIDLPNCTGEQLTAIYMKLLKADQAKAKENGCRIEWIEEFEKAVREHFCSIDGKILSDRAFGNGGYARNLMEATVSAALARTNEGRSLSNLCFDLTLDTADLKAACCKTKII